MKQVAVDIVILGGGIAGLWLLSALRQQGYSVLLFEKTTLGNGQTICAQGIIHGGTKYAVKQVLTPVAKSIANMPQQWRQCLAGKGELDLQNVQVLSEHQHLLVPGGLLGKFTGFLCSKVMQSRVQKLSVGQYPAILSDHQFNGEVYALDEPVLNVSSLLNKLATQASECIYQGEAKEIHYHQDGASIIIHDQQGITVNISVQRLINTAGAGNEDLLAQLGLVNKLKMQRRPLHMLMLKGMPVNLYAHAVDNHFKPRVTITSHLAPDGEIVWYMGGEIAVQGVKQTPQQVFDSGMASIREILPSIDLSHVKWRTWRIDRAEPQQTELQIPDGPAAFSHQAVIIAWPVKLAFAPMLTQQVIGLLSKVKPREKLPIDLPFTKPTVSILPWQLEGVWN